MSGNLAELKQMKIWVCWKFIEKDGRKTKKPIAASGGSTGSNKEYEHTWVTFDEAKKAADKRENGGVGFIIPEGYFFLDIDHRPLDDPFVTKMLERFNSYTERSVSGEGIHIYGKCDFKQLPTEKTKKGKIKLAKRYYLKNPHNSTELYIGGLTNRFAVFTEDTIVDEPLKDCTNAVLITLEKDMLRAAQPKPPKEKPGVKTVIIDGENAESEYWDIICKLRKQKNGEKFCKLYDEGDFSDYGSQSEADCALCAMIAFRVGADNEAIDKIFRSSKLYREKWERDDYREETIEKGIESCHGVFHRLLMPHPDFIRFNEMTDQPYVVVPLLAKHVREHMDYLLVRDSGKQGLLKYVYNDGVYKLYADEMFKGCIKQFVEDYDPELVKIGQINEAYQHILTDRNYISQDELDDCENIINFKNGLLMIDEKELKLVPHTPGVYSTIQIPCNWTGRKSDTPVFLQYLKTLTDANKDVARLLLQFTGACLSNIKGWRMKKSLFLVGDGDTGKSQLKSLVEKLLGKGNFIGTDLSEIEARFGTGTIYGTRLAGSSDMSFMTVSELKTFKKITGGDSLFAEFKGQQGFEFTYSGLLWFCMNRLPKFGGDDGKWVYNRIMVVNCPNVISPEKQDKRLLDKMYRERQGIIYKAINALLNVIKNDYRFTESESVTQAREDYMTDNNTAIAFFNECMRPWVKGKIQKHCTTGRVYKVYQAWCRENNNGYAKTAKEFREELSAYLGSTFADLTVVRNGYKYYKDYGLTLESKDLYASAYGYDEDDFLPGWSGVGGA